MAPWRPRSVQEPPVSTGRFTFGDAASMHLQESTTGRGRFRYGRVRLRGTQPSLVLFAHCASRGAWRPPRLRRRACLSRGPHRVARVLLLSFVHSDSELGVRDTELVPR